MEAKLFKDLTGLLKKAETGDKLSKITLEHANNAQAVKLFDTYGDLYTVDRNNDIIARRAKRVKRGSDKSKGGTPKKADNNAMSVMIGSYGHEAGATQEASQFMHPNVFQYQSALFPSPVDHGVNVLVVSAVPTEIPTPATPLYPWTVTLKLEITGPEAACKSWRSRFEGRIRSQRIT